MYNTDDDDAVVGQKERKNGVQCEDNTRAHTSTRLILLLTRVVCQLIVFAIQRYYYSWRVFQFPWWRRRELSLPAVPVITTAAAAPAAVRCIHTTTQCICANLEVSSYNLLTVTHKTTEHHTSIRQQQSSS